MWLNLADVICKAIKHTKLQFVGICLYEIPTLVKPMETQVCDCKGCVEEVMKNKDFVTVELFWGEAEVQRFQIEARRLHNLVSSVPLGCSFQNG